MSPPYTPEDQALLVALADYESELCRCGHPRSTAWHPHMDGGWYERRSYKCHACTAWKGEDVIYDVAVDVRDPGHLDLPPFDLDDALVDGAHTRTTSSQEVDASVG